MIEKHFGFRTTPFTRELPIRERFSLPFLDEQIKAIEDVVKSRMSALLIAPPGTGKSVVLRTVVDRLPEARYRTSYFNLTRLSGRDLCREIARAVGAKPTATYPALVRSVQERFENNVSSDGIRPVLIFDDAHAMRPEGFELLKVLTNFDMDSRLVVSFILAGHPSLRKQLYREDTEDVRQRITHFGELRLLSRDESVKYIKHRINIIGCRTIPFDNETLEGLYELSRGNMRAIDTLAFISLRRAAESGEAVVSQQHLHKARAEVWI
jgi:general secretion pathway protein A